jgi:hypothetical protein
MNSESKNSNDFENAAAKIKGLLIFRNNCGVLRDDHGRPVFYGVGGPSPRNTKGLGGSDYIGLHNGRFCAFEIKADADNTSAERLAKQQNFLRVIITMGGCAGFVRRPADIHAILEGRGCTILAHYPRERLS